jgi:hypothetical protein
VVVVVVVVVVASEPINTAFRQVLHTKETMRARCSTGVAKRN